MDALQQSMCVRCIANHLYTKDGVKLVKTFFTQVMNGGQGRWVPMVNKCTTSFKANEHAFSEMATGDVIVTGGKPIPCYI